MEQPTERAIQQSREPVGRARSVFDPGPRRNLRERRTALDILEDLGRDSGSERVQAWLGILRAIRTGSLEGEAAAFGRLEKEGLSALAFRAG